ncbi:MAG: ribonucleoside-diphosphate reductase, adenosylcobalamin-dependent, partial [Gammaproteobacteria bacterium]
MNAKAQAVITTIPMQEASLDIWNSKYQLKTKTGEPVDKDINATYERVAKALAEVENKSVRTKHMKDFIWALQNGAIPAGRITSNAGAEAHKPATSTINCTVSGTVHDSMNDILEKNHEAGLTLKAGCGIGYEFSTLRPRGAYVAGAGATTSGPLSFMDIFDRMCFTVSSAGGRRGAQMATFDIHHPDIIEFIQAKREDGRLRQFNLSLLITEDFIEAVRNGDDWHLSFPVTQKEAEEEGLDLADASQFLYRDFPVLDGYVVNDEGKVACRIYKTVKAQFIWDTIMTSTYDYAEPGFILIDKVNQMNNNWFCEDIRATNPCGEQPLPPYGSCLLGSVNLTKFVDYPFTEKASFNYEKYRKVVGIFTRMLDNVVEINGLP